MPLKMYFYLQMLMKLQKSESSFKRIRILRVLCLQLPFLPEEESRTQGLICEWILSASSWVWACCLWGKFKHRGFFWAFSSSGHRASGFLKMLPPHPGHLEGHWEGVWPRPMQATYPNSLAGSRLWLLSLRILSLWSLVRPSSKDHCLLYCSAQGPKAVDKEWQESGGKDCFVWKRLWTPFHLERW